MIKVEIEAVVYGTGRIENPAITTTISVDPELGIAVADVDAAVKAAIAEAGIERWEQYCATEADDAPYALHLHGTPEDNGYVPSEGMVGLPDLLAAAAVIPLDGAMPFGGGMIIIVGGNPFDFMTPDAEDDTAQWGDWTNPDFRFD